MQFSYMQLTKHVLAIAGKDAESDNIVFNAWRYLDMALHSRSGRGAHEDNGRMVPQDSRPEQIQPGFLGVSCWRVGKETITCQSRKSSPNLVREFCCAVGGSEQLKTPMHQFLLQRVLCMLHHCVDNLTQSQTQFRI